MSEGVTGTTTMSPGEHCQARVTMEHQEGVPLCESEIPDKKPAEGSVAGRSEAPILGPPPYKLGHYTALDQARAKVLGLRIRTESDMCQRSERTVELQVGGTICVCFKLAAGEHLVLTQRMYEILWTSYLLPAGASSPGIVLDGQPAHETWPFVLLTKGRGMPYPVAWVDDAQRQLGVHRYLAEVASMHEVTSVRDPEDQYAWDLIGSDHERVFGQDYLEYWRRSAPDRQLGQQSPPKGALSHQPRNTLNHAYVNNPNRNRTKHGWRSYPAYGQSSNQTPQYVAGYNGPQRRGVSRVRRIVFDGGVSGVPRSGQKGHGDKVDDQLDQLVGILGSRAP